MSLDLGGLIRQVVDLGSESYEDRTAQIVVLAGLVLFGAIVLWRLAR